MLNFEAFTLCTTSDQIANEATLQARSMGFDYWAYSAKVLHGSRYAADWSLHNLPDDLWHAYAGCSVSVDDPIVHRSRSQMTPRVWLLEAPSDTGDVPRQAHPLLQEAQRSGIVGGLCMPVHDLDGAVGTLTLSTCQPLTHDTLVTAAPPAMLFSKLLHEACGRCVFGAQRGKVPALSPRELECLTWVSKGKTSWEISRVLEISEHTANFHLRNAMAKLGTANRQQAVARSIQLGLLSVA